MQTKKLFLGICFLCTLLSCKKDVEISNNSSTNSTATESGFSINGNHLQFNSIQEYKTATGNDSLQQELVNYLGEKNFTGMVSNDLGLTNPARMNSLNTDSTDEDLDNLYPEYLRQILNADSIVQIGTYLFKIDLVNDKALVINIGTSDAYEILKNSTLYPDNPNLMSFYEDEDVFDILDWISSGHGTYAQYVEERVGKDIPFFCHDKGADRGKEKAYYYYDPTNRKVRLKAELTYQKAIIYFRLFAEGKAQKKRGLWVRDPATSLYLGNKYKWVQRCKRLSDAGGGSQDGVAGPKIQFVAYSGAKSLRQYDMYSGFGIKRVSWPFYQIFSSPVALHIISGY